jgi:FkbM family methyltransferase
MVHLISRYVSNIVKIASGILVPQDRRQVRHFRTAGFELLAFANEDVGRKIWLTGKFEAAETAFFASKIKAGDVCFDVGGNVGYMAMLFALYAKEGAVHVFEPIPLNASLVTTNTRLNGFKNVVVNNVAVSNAEGTVVFNVSADSAYSSMIDTGRKKALEQIVVPTVTLDKYVAKNAIGRVDVLKVDVEGAEPLVIDGATGLLADASKRPRLVLLELFDVNLKPFDSTVLKLVEKMRGFGYRAVTLSNGLPIDFVPEIANLEPNIFFLLGE